MTHVAEAKAPTIIFGVTTSQSLKLLGKLPEAMIKRGWEVHVVADEVPSDVAENRQGIDYHALRMARSPSVLEDIISLLRWIVLLIKVKPSVVATGTPKAGLLGMVSAILCRVPVRIYQLRGLRLQTATGMQRYLLFLMEWLTSVSSTHVLAVSASLRDEYTSLGFCQGRKIRVLGFGSSHGVDTKQFNPERWSGWEPPEPYLRAAIAGGSPILGFVGRFSVDKGSKELLECHLALAQSGFDHTLLVVGPIEGHLPTTSNQSFESSKLIFTGSVKDVAPYYTVMDILLLPTHREGFPNVVLEAASSRIPAITTNATGAADSVIHGKTGLITKIGDVPSLIGAVELLLRSRRLRSRMGAHALARARRSFEAGVIANKHATFFVAVHRLAMSPD